jgi:hypothetical protein
MWTLVYHNGYRHGYLVADTAEHIAVNYAQNASGVLRCAASLWHGTALVCAFDSGVERDLTHSEYVQATTALFGIPLTSE